LTCLFQPKQKELDQPSALAFFYPFYLACNLDNTGSTFLDLFPTAVVVVAPIPPLPFPPVVDIEDTLIISGDNVLIEDVDDFRVN
jgi:hypothetical protein